MTSAAPPSAAEAFVERLLATHDADKRRALIARHGLTPADLHDAVLRLTDAADRLLGVDPRRMEQVCLDAVALADQSEDESLRAMARMRCGDALRGQGRNAEALGCFDEAAAIFTRLGRPVEAARTRIGWVWSAAALGRFTEALAAARAARRVLTAHGATFYAARLEQSTGVLHYQQGRYRDALHHAGVALTLFRSLGEQGRLDVGRCHANCGLFLTRLGRYRDALAELTLAREIYQEMGEHGGAARVARSIGELQMDLGHYAAALHAFDQARPLFRTLGQHNNAVTTAVTAVDCYLRLNRPADALALLDDAEEDLQRIDETREGLGLAAYRVAALLRLGEQNRALAALDNAERQYPAGAVEYRGWLALQRATALLREGTAAEALIVACRAADLARAAGTRRLTADALISEGTALLDLGRPDEAARAAHRARRLARELDAAPLLHRAHELLGRVAEAQGRTALARRYYRTAIAQLEREQRGVIFEFRDSFAEERGGAYERLAALQLDAGRAAEALVTAERAKSRALADAIAGAVELRPRGNAAVRALTRELIAAREDYAAAFARASRDEDHPNEDRETDAHRLAELEARIVGLVRRLQIAGAADDLADLYSATAGVALPAAPAGTALIEFFFSGDDLLRFVVRDGRVHGERLAGAVPDVERLLRAFRLNLDATEQAAADVRRLAAQAHAVLGRLEARLLGGLDLAACPALVIVPHGLLHYLPFHALHDGARYLVERHAVGYAPSAALYGICRARAARPRPRREKALVLAHSGGGLLPFALDEAEAVADVLGAPVHREAAATRALLEREGRRAGLIHVAAHGRFRPDAPLFSHIELADGPLTAADIFRLDLRAALVTLSACETGRAVIGGGDELVGLARAFLYAGAAGLLVSQWRVDDASTARLMARFYRQLGQGTGPAEALRAAQIACITDGMAQNERSHPFFWAGFQIIGDDHGVQRRPVRVREVSRR